MDGFKGGKVCPQMSKNIYAVQGTTASSRAFVVGWRIFSASAHSGSAWLF